MVPAQSLVLSARGRGKTGFALANGGDLGNTLRPTTMNPRCNRVLSVAALLGALTTVAGEPARPHARAVPVGLAEVRWTDGFWAERQRTLREVTLPALGALMAGTNYSQFFRNFEIAAGLAEGRARGAPFNDGECYKLIEAASAMYAVTGDDYFDRALDRAIRLVAAAQRDDGYLFTRVLIAQRQGDPNAVPFRDRNNFEIYNFGHLFTAAAVHHQATGKTNLLAVALRAAAFLERTFADPTPELARHNVCPSHYLGLLDLYRVTGDRRWLALAERFLAQRDLVARAGLGGDDNQDRVPFLEQDEALGHAVRANYLFAGAADLFLETGDAATWAMLRRVWTNVVQRKLYVTGGCGALYDGASPDAAKNQAVISRTHQAYGRNYQLPNTTAHNETCAAIGNVLWNWRMFLGSGEAAFLDVAELSLHNAVLSGISLDGTNFHYTNPLRVTDPLPVELRWPRERVPFLSSFCCPPNVARTLAGLGGLAYATSSNAVWVTLYGANTLATTLEGRSLRLAQETEFPWNGRIRLRVVEWEGPPLALRLRIPGWASRGTVRVNLGPVMDTTAPGSFFELRRAWRAGDVVDLDLDMRVEPLEAHPLVEETLGQVAVRRGPLVYCLESVGLPDGVRVLDVCVPEDARFLARYDQRLLGGVVTLDATLVAKPPGDWQGELYRPARRVEARPVKVRLVPYYAWGNRGPGEMSVWLRRP